jgi:hypothetical protein
MALDGPKIIDGDLANDVYGEFMELYNSGNTIEDIKTQIEKSWKKEDFDEDDFEIFITTYALALWETGELSKEILDEVKVAVEKGAGVSMWKEEGEEEYAEKRKRVLEKFIIKISEPKKKIRARMKKKESKDFIFQPDDLLVYKTEDELYHTTIVYNTYQHNGSLDYLLVPIQFVDSNTPSVEKINNESIFITKIHHGFPIEEVQIKFPGVEKFWRDEKVRTIPYIIGLFTIRISHRNLSKFSSMFEVLGKIRIKESFKHAGLIGSSSTFEEFVKRATEKYDYIENKELIPLFKILD